ncbi:MAG: hypothetical protein C6I01_04615 [Epsilonproteobacteria bacterium]|jgi:DNA recombination protein RmuC|nr:hypothetical protein [Campylobacterota bacterium]NPA89559.1 DNA recombination protein RmuC [Campylobacterota bacterium]
MEIFWVVAGGVFSALTFTSLFFWWRSREIGEELELERRGREKLEREVNLLREEKQKLEMEKGRLEIQLEERSRTGAQLEKMVEELGIKIGELQRKKLAEESRGQLSQLLLPFQTQLEEFRRRLEELHQTEAGKIGKLEGQLLELANLNRQLSEEAEKLTSALKGEIKTQGTFGEVLLERLLELSGIPPEIGYRRQVRLKGKDGKNYIPDVVVYLPENRQIIIDAKTPLTLYRAYLDASTEKEKEWKKKEFWKGVRREIDRLAERGYKILLNTPDSIFLFFPVEGMFQLALEDPQLLEYGVQKGVFLTSPTTLIPALRGVELVWRYKLQLANMGEIGKIADELYNNARILADYLIKVGDYLEKANKNYQLALNKLRLDKSRNLFTSAQKLKTATGIHPQKEISSHLLSL